MSSLPSHAGKKSKRLSISLPGKVEKAEPNAGRQFVDIQRLLNDPGGPNSKQEKPELRKTLPVRLKCIVFECRAWISHAHIVITDTL